jgi:hypothetical protein
MATTAMASGTLSRNSAPGFGRQSDRDCRPFRSSSQRRRTMRSTQLWKNGRKPAATPQALRDQAQHATRLAQGTSDKQANAALLAFAQELLQKAAQLEATSTSATAEATGPATAIQDTESTKPPDEKSRPIPRKKKPRR